MKNLIAYANELMSRDLHNWILAALVVEYLMFSAVLMYFQLRLGVAPDMAITKHVGDTLIWWGGIVATAHTGKSVVTTWKGNGNGGTPPPAEGGPP